MGMRSCVVLILWFKKCVFQFGVTLVVQLFLHVLACLNTSPYVIGLAF